MHTRSSPCSYGVKIRLPHALVMTFLFHEGSLREKLLYILRATFQHAKNLAFFVTIYKSLLYLLWRLSGRGHPVHNFLSAFVGGYFVFGENNKVNMQINLYLLSRITLGLAKTLVRRGYLPEPSFDLFPWFGALVWGVVLCLYEYEKRSLQPSLQSSMTYLYHDSTVWGGVWDFLAYNSARLW